MATSIMTSHSALKRNKDMRRHRRYAVEPTILQVYYLDATGKMKVARTKAVNISEGGIAFEVPEAVQPMSMIRFQSDKYKLFGSGAVRHCSRVGSKYIVGLEFNEGLHWTPPEGDVVEPIPICPSVS
jgi:hypothetical protein